MAWQGLGQTVSAMLAGVRKMLSENNDRRMDSPACDNFHLLPWHVVACGPGLRDDDRMIEAQGAMNRFQVWIGDLFTDLACRWARRHETKRAPGAGRALR
jgi:hypothetical protein